jgi:DNA repair protein SbcC/Rad50
MRIRYIHLNNIRSYVNKRIEFPEGSILLSGNIGSGKTSLLLAVDFALFGFRKGNLSGNGLLRKGSDLGFVELSYEVNGKEVVIRRNLKRSALKVSQASGVIEINGIREELGPTELKQKILTLFNYPKESLTRSKALIYNYTVYTPQEEMKAILQGDSEERLNILRRVFGIDKYKRILENLKVLTTKLKDRKKELNLLSSNLEQVVQEKEIKISRFKEINDNLENLKVKFGEIEKIFELKNKELEEIETKNKERDKVINDQRVLNSKLDSSVSLMNRNDSNISNLNGEINNLEAELKSFQSVDSELLNKKISGAEEDIRKLESNNLITNKKIGEIEFLVNRSEELKRDIGSLELCPTCKQDVSETHKKEIYDKEDLELKKSRELYREHKETHDNNLNLINELKETLEELRKDRGRIEVYLAKKNSFDDKTNYLRNILEEQKRLKIEISELNSTKLGYDRLLENFLDYGSEIEKKKIEINEIVSVKGNLNSEIFASEREREMIRERINELNFEISEKEKFKGNVVKYSEMISFLDTDFSGLMATIEKQIMKKVHSDFDSIFKEWFGVLIDSEDLEIGLDYSFTPVIRQNGYDIDYDHLSGGERTAAALSYRLALNHIINTIMSDINTKDILILDEPTDGFSSEQVDKLRIVLESLKAEQIIIVSHDPKIESFVDNVIKFEKKEGESFVY